MTTNLFYHTYFFNVGSCARCLQNPHPAGGWVGDVRAPKFRYAVFALGVAADPCPGEAELARLSRFDSQQTVVDSSGF